MLSNTENKYRLGHLIRDIFIVAGSIIISIILAKSGSIEALIKIGSDFTILSSLIAGAFFTSIFTIAPATVSLVAISQSSSPFLVAGIGALGASLIDNIIITFIRKDISDDLENLSHLALRRHFIQAFHFGFLKWVAFGLGLIFISTPLPDELGLFLIGISKVKSWTLPFIFYIAHFIGILVIISIINGI